MGIPAVRRSWRSWICFRYPFKDKEEMQTVNDFSPFKKYQCDQGIFSAAVEKGPVQNWSPSQNDEKCLILDLCGSLNPLSWLFSLLCVYLHNTELNCFALICSFIKMAVLIHSQALSSERIDNQEMGRDFLQPPNFGNNPKWRAVTHT